MGQRSETEGAPRRRRDWDGVAAVVAAMIGFLALVVSGYTAYVQRQQVRAQVWPWLVVGNNDLDRSVAVYNKGVGPAIVRGAQVFVDDKPQTDWDHVFEALGVPMPPHSYYQSTLNPNVLSAGEQEQLIRFSDEAVWKRFRAAALDHMAMNICFCSTLDECWMYSDRHPVGFKATTQLINPIGQCPRLDDAVTFKN